MGWEVHPVKHLTLETKYLGVIRVVPADARQVVRDVLREAPAFRRGECHSAFLSEVFRAGIDSIEAGQREAGVSLGMTRWQIMRFIVLPQAFRNVLPPLANDFISMLKESSLVPIVGVNDITRQGATFASANFLFFQSYNVIALTYFVLTLTLAIAVKTLEAYLDRGKRRSGG